MKCYARRFNLYLLLLGAGLLAVAGCKTGGDSDKQTASLRIYLENRAQVIGSGQTVSVLRTSPVLVTINSEPALTEANIIAATVLTTPGGYAIEVKFDEMGTLMLEQFSAANIGRHFAIFSQWSDKTMDSRWLAAPIIVHRIPNGLFSFTPDASLDEDKKIVRGLNNMAKKIAKGKMK